MIRAQEAPTVSKPRSDPAQWREILARAQTRFGAAACSLALLEGEQLAYVAAVGPGAERLVGSRLPTDRGIAGWVTQSEQAVVVADAGADERFARDVAESTGYVPTSMIVVPVFTGAGLLGVLSVLDPDAAGGRPGSVADIDIATAFAGELAGTRPAWTSAFDPVPSVVGDDLPLDAGWAFAGDGAGVLVAVLDSGIDLGHPDVAGPARPGVAVGWDGHGPVLEAGPHEDLFGHGTACASVLRRVAPAAELVSVRVLGSRLSARGEAFAAGLRWAIDSGARVLNLSLSSASESMRATLYELTDRAAHAGVVVICAMNNTAAPTYPSSFGSVISVAACTDPGTWPLLANPNPPADFAAPGIGLELAWSGGSRIRASGNSFAAPHIAGLVARLLSAHPQLTPYQVKSVLRSVAANVTTEVRA
jgi:subtilisin family serine protease